MDSRRSSSAVRRTGPARRTAELNPCSIQLDRSSNWTGPAWRTAELNPRSIQLGRSPYWTGPAWRTAELNLRSIELGRSPNWTGPSRRTSKLNPRLIQLGRSSNWTGPARRTAELNSCSIARPFTELDWSSSAVGRAESVFNPVWPFAELNLVQLGEQAELNSTDNLACSFRRTDHQTFDSFFHSFLTSFFF